MSTYVPVSVALGNITLPADGENIDAVDVNAPLQSVADGVKFLQARTDVLADLTALAALAAPANGLVRHVATHGLYVFQTSATTGLSPFRVAATDATPGGWLASAAHEVTLTRKMPCTVATGISCTAATQTVAAVVPSKDAQFVPMIAADANIVGGGLYPARSYTLATNHFGYFLPLDAWMLDGATLSAAALKYRPNPGHGGLPSRFVNLGIFRSVRTGHATLATALLSTGTGFVADTEAVTATYNNTDRSLAFTPDQNNVVDKSTYRYFALIWDEAGTNALGAPAYQDIDLTFTGIPDGRR